MASSYDKEFMSKFRGIPCLICGTRIGTHAEHVKTKGSGGKDSSENVHAVCLIHHDEKSKFGISWMAEKYPTYKKWLNDNGWFYALGKWRKNEE